MKTAESKISSPAIQRKANKPFFGKGKEGIFEKPVQAKLTVGKTDDAYEKEADAMADKVVQKKSINEDVTPIRRVTAPVQSKCDNCENEEKQNEKIEEGEDQQLQRKPIFESNAEPPDEADNTIQRSAIREWEEGDKVVQLSETDQTPKSDGSRESIVAAAKGELGKVEAKLNDGTGSRIGADRLLEYFNIAAPGVWEDSIISTAGAKMPSWCGIFSVWAHKKAGKDIGEWQMGKGVSAFNTLTTTDSPKPGDIGYVDKPNQHHNIVKEVNGDSITTIDGNSGVNSEVKENTHPRSEYSGFMTAFGGGEAAGNVQSKSEPAAPSNTAPSSVESGISSTKGKGSSLPESTRNEMESSFGTDFSDVRIHTGNTASTLSRDLNAQAFTHGSDIYFNSGKYDTSSTAGKHLLAHELTHTIQQGSASAVNTKPDIQRNGGKAKETVEDKIKKVTTPMANGDKMIIDGSDIQVRLFDFPLKSYVPNVPTSPVLMPKSGTKRDNKHKGVWTKSVKQDITKALATVTGNVKKDDLLRLNLKSLADKAAANPKLVQSGMVGTSTELIGEIEVPFWDMKGKSTIHEIEHAIDVQILGNTLANAIGNLVLLDEPSNKEAGKTVSKTISDRVKAVLQHYKLEETDVRITEALAKYKVYFDTFKKDASPAKIKSLMLPGDFAKDEKENPISKELIVVTPAAIPPGHLMLKTSADGVGYILPYNFDNEVLTLKGNAKEGKLEKVTFKKPWGDKNNVTNVSQTKPMDLKFTPEEGKPHTYKVDANLGGAAQLIQDNIKLNHLSPIKIDEGSIKLDPHAGLSLTGKIETKVKPLEDVNIDFIVENGEFTLRASVDFDKIKIPEPFKVNYCTVFLEASTSKDFNAGGEVGFSINKLGDGFFAVKGGTSGLFFTGEFTLDKEIFDGTVSVKYAKKKGEEEGSWTIGGKVTIGKDKIKGLEKLSVEIESKEDKLTGKGSAVLNIPGIKGVDITVEAHKNGDLTIGGQIDFSKVPKLKGGTGGFKIEKKKGENGAESWDIGMSGKVKPDIDFKGLKIDEVEVSYFKGKFDIKATASFKAGERLSGEFTAGATNKAVVDGKKPVGDGEGGKEMSFWVDGKIKVKITENIGADIDVHVTPDGDITLDAKIPLTKSVPLFKKLDFEKTPLDIKKSIPLFSCGIVTLKLNTGLKVRLYANLAPLTFDEGSYVKLNNVSLKDPSAANITTLIKVSSHLDAGLALTLTLGLGVSLLGVLNADVNGEGTLDFTAISADAHAEFGAKWSLDKGVTLEKGELSIDMISKLTASLDATARVYADLLFTELTIWEHKWELAKVEKKISMFSGKLNIPLPIGDDGGIKMNDGDMEKNVAPVNEKATPENMEKRSDAVLNGDGTTEEDKQAEADKTIKEDVLASFRDEERFNFRKCQDYLIDRYALVNHLRAKAQHEKKIDLSYIEEEIEKAEYEEYDAFGPFIEKEDFDAETKRDIIEDFIDNHPTLNETQITNLRGLVPAKPVQKKSEAAPASPANTNAAANQIDSAKGKGEPLPGEVQQDMESSFGADFNDVRVHDDPQAAGISDSLNAKAFTTGSDIFFNSGQYNTNSSAGKHLLAHELTHVVQQGNGNGHDIQRREFGPTEDANLITEGDWAYGDRLTKQPRWDASNAYNLENARSRQYTQIDQRRDFYLWFYNKMRERGHEVKWPLAAYVVAGGANEVANRDPGRFNAIRGNNLEQLMRRGNQVIFDDVFPKLRQLWLRKTPLVGDEAQKWDMQTLIEEQNLIQPLYKDLSPDELKTMEDLAKQKGFFATVGSGIFGRVDGGPYHSGGKVPPFPADYDISKPEHRYRYGMALAHFFSNGAADFAASKTWAETLAVPEAPEEYKNGEMLKRYDNYNNLHRLSSIVSDTASTVDEIRQAVWQLTDNERQIAMTDPWFSATLRHIHHMSPIEAEAVLRSEDTSKCGPLFQVIGGIEGTGIAKEEDNIIVWLRKGSWTTFSGQQRVQVQAVSDPAYKMFKGVPLRWVWQSSLHCYPKKKPLPPPPPPIDKVYTVYFDTQSDLIMSDSHEWNNRWELNNVLSDLRDYGSNPNVADMQLYITGHASPIWKSAKTAAAAATENEQLAMRRAKNVRTYIMDVYQQYKGPVSMMVLNPLTDAVMVPVPANTTPAKVVSDEGKGSQQGLAETADPKNNDQRYRRVDISIRVVFDNVKTP